MTPMGAFKRERSWVEASALLLMSPPWDPPITPLGAFKREGYIVMGNHRSVRANSGQRRGWRRVAIVGAVVGIGYATVGVVGLASGTTTPTPSVYSAVAPVTVLGRSLAADSNTDVAVAGVGSVPSNATSVQLSVTALDGTTTSSMYVYPTGATKPTSANVRWQAGETVTIPVTVAVGTSGDVRLSTDPGTVTVKVAVVGYFSPAPAPGGASYATTANDLDLNSAALTMIASLTVPAGTYEVQAKATIEMIEGSSDTVFCRLYDPSSAVVDYSYISLDSSIFQTPVVLMGLDTTSGGAMTFDCRDGGNNSSAGGVELLATQVSSASGTVAGG
jgi:hypothetical protein